MLSGRGRVEEREASGESGPLPENDRLYLNVSLTSEKHGQVGCTLLCACLID